MSPVLRGRRPGDWEALICLNEIGLLVIIKTSGTFVSDSFFLFFRALTYIVLQKNVAFKINLQEEKNLLISPVLGGI